MPAAFKKLRASPLCSFSDKSAYASKLALASHNVVDCSLLECLRPSRSSGRRPYAAFRIKALMQASLQHAFIRKSAQSQLLPSILSNPIHGVKVIISCFFLAFLRQKCGSKVHSVLQNKSLDFLFRKNETQVRPHRTNLRCFDQNITIPYLFLTFLCNCESTEQLRSYFSMILSTTSVPAQRSARSSVCWQPL